MSMEYALPSRTNITFCPSVENCGFDSADAVSMRCRAVERLMSTIYKSPAYATTFIERSREYEPSATSGPTESTSDGGTSSGFAPACARMRYGLSASRKSELGGSHWKKIHR